MFKLSFRHQVLAGFIFSLLIVIGAVGAANYSIVLLKENQALVDISDKKIQLSYKILSHLTTCESDQRGYLISQESAFLDSFKASENNIDAAITELEAIINNENQHQDKSDILQLRQLIGEQLTLMNNIIELAKTKGIDVADDNITIKDGKKIMNQVSRVINKMIDNESKKNAASKLAADRSTRTTYFILLIGGITVVGVVILLFSYIQRTFNQQKQIEKEILLAKNELEEVLEQNENKNWLLTGLKDLNDQIQGEQEEQDLSEKTLHSVASYLRADVGTLYLYDDVANQLYFSTGYAFHDLSAVKTKVKLGEGWLGKIAQVGTMKVIKGGINNKQLKSSIITEEISESILLPFHFNQRLKGVLELGFIRPYEIQAEDYLKGVADIIGIAFNTAHARKRMQELFEETQQQAEELAAQQEELRTTNEELLYKTEKLQASEEELRVQQEELMVTNTELEEKASLLEEKNTDIEEARQAITMKMEELEVASKYKSEFLANMSHELRTPLNSILVLARILRDNKFANLNGDQIKYANVIFNAGNDLLTLINDILDLSKIESGKVELENENVALNVITQDMEALFAEVATNKGITFSTHIAAGVAEIIYTDLVKVEQIIKNLLSNAFKFTPKDGCVQLNIRHADEAGFLAIAVKDSGIGISEDKQKVIFEAFKQADGSTSREYGGTGLGLSISRELANLLGGKITLKSSFGEGSEFVLLLPAKSNTMQADQGLKTSENLPDLTLADPLLLSTRKKVTRGKPLVLIVEDDRNFADILNDYALQHGYQSVIWHNGAGVIELAKEKQPDAIILDIMLPNKNGWEILKGLKADPDTASIPVHMMSAGDVSVKQVKTEGAIGFLKKPISNNELDQLFNELFYKDDVAFKQVLLVEDQEIQSTALKELLEGQGITVDQAFDGKSAVKMLHENDYQCVVLDLNLPDISGYDLLDQLKQEVKFSDLPVIINTAMELDKHAVQRLMKHSNAMVLKSNKSAERLIDEVNLFLHKVSSKNPDAPSSSKPKPDLVASKSTLQGKKVLLVDDDMRNIFALSSALQEYEIEVEIANDGEEALEKLQGMKHTDLVLMDIMMPKMDGYEAMRHIRKENKWAKLPIIALTAKAMKDDRDKCIAAGANDYITKPVDLDRLVALMQVWMEK